MRTKRKKHEPWTGAWFLELALIVAVALGLALGIQAFLVKPYRIPSESMEPTLDIGQRVLVNRIGNRFSEPEIGDIVVFHPPQGAEENRCADPRAGQGTRRPCDEATSQEADVNFIKRVVAGPGDTIAVEDGHVILNGKRQDEPFINECGGVPECNMPDPIKVPADHWYMMGDNRGRSADSRIWGPVPKEWIIGGAFATYWPPTRIGLL
ncbi:MAG TPA: signal peptidase I [Capillimicrobium sp.]|nr:signal peptidase I [Capillimicrobium sp.]